MQKCIVVSTPDAEFSALAFKEDFNKSIIKVAELGFDAVELAVRDPENVASEKILGLVRENGLIVPAIGTGQAFGQEGLSYTDRDKSIREQAVERTLNQIRFASVFGAQVIIGLIRGLVEKDVGFQRAEEYFADAIKRCADYAGEFNVTLTIEPINRYETNLYNTVDECLEVVNKIGRDNVKLLIDTFHMNIEEPDILESIKKAGRMISHVHIADSNRWAPGLGHIDFAAVIDTLNDVDYNGALSAEILPKPDPDSSVRLTIKYMKQLGL